MRLLVLFFTVSRLLTPSLYGQPLSGYSYHADDVFGYLNNDALLPASNSIAGGIFYERPYQVEGINRLSAVFIFPVQRAGFGLSLERAGCIGLTNSIMGLGYGRKLSEKISAGVHFNFHTEKIPRYASSSGLSYGSGIIIYPVSKLHTGFYFDRSATQLNYYFGIGFDASSSALISFIIYKETDEAAMVNASLFYRPVKNVFVKGGITSNTSVIWLSAGWEVNRFRIEVCSNYHQQLGLSPGVSLQFRGKEKN